LQRFAGDDAAIVRDVNGDPAPQYYNPATGKYEYVEGSDGAPKVTLSGSTSETVVSRQILRQNTGINISVPDGVRGAVFLCRVYGATGSGGPQLTFISDTYLPFSSQSAPRLASSPLSSGGSRMHYWVVG